MAKKITWKQLCELCMYHRVKPKKEAKCLSDFCAWHQDWISNIQKIKCEFYNKLENIKEKAGKQ